GNRGNVGYRTGARYEFLAAVKMRRVFLNLQVGDEVILVGKISDAPGQAGGDSFRPRLGAKLDLPLHSILIAHEEFWAGPVHIFLGEGERALRLMVFAARTIEQVTGRAVGRIAPEHRVAVGGNFCSGG